jgi:hypothetical protein
VQPEVPDAQQRIDTRSGPDDLRVQGVRPAVGLHVSMVSIQETIPQSSAGAVSVHGHLPGGREGAVGTAEPVGLAWSRTLQGSGHCERLPGKLGAVTPSSDNITFYWLTNTAISSARLYWEFRQTAKAGFFDAKGVTIPVGVSANPSEIYTAPKSWAERAFPKLLHYGRTPKGCHFAAWEQPKIFTDEVRASFKTLRT